ncbi:MAG: glutathione S-transferase family protein [Rhizobiaceae bacterium]|nr:glutathione S-transferase family protein [Rhizobiaceae bacterium]
MYELLIGNKNYSSWSLRPWILLKARGIPFVENKVAFPGGDSFDYFRAWSPSGRVPLLTDGDVKVWDSLAIVEYVAERHPGAWPGDPVARAWARCASAEMHSSFQTLRNVCGMSCGIRVKLGTWPDGLARDVARIGELWREGLSRFGGPYLAGGEFTGVDAFFAPVAFRAQTYGLSFGGAADDYATRMLAEPAMVSWYEDALAETWREPGHDAEPLAFGHISQDLRAIA